MTSPHEILISCGEASGDLYASRLVEAVGRRRPEVRAFGLGGSRCEASGMDLVVRLEEVSVIGLVEVIGKLPVLSEAMARLCVEAERRRPALAVLIDFSGFNLRLARRLKAMGIRIVYYVSPQVWAWRRGRIRAIRDYVDELLLILPFEQAFYESEGVEARYVGHPLVDIVEATAGREDFCRGVGLDAERPFVMLLPGSRRREVDLHLPILLGAVSTLSRARPELQFLLSRAETIPEDFLASRLGAADLRVVAGAPYDALAHAAAAAVASGTATVEAALLETPMVVVYRVGRMSYALGKPFVRVPHFSMVNLIAGRALVPELIQGDMTPENIAEHLSALVDDGGERARAQKQGLRDVRRALGGGGASDRAAEAVLEHFGVT